MSIRITYKRFRSLPFRIKLAAGYVCLILLISIFADVIANDVPVLVKKEGHMDWSIANRSAYLSKHNEDNPGISFKINAPVSFYYSTQDQESGLVKPFTPGNPGGKTHWLGTDTYSRDVLAGLIHGSKIAIWVGLIATVLSALIGLLLGSLAGYYQDNKLTTNGFVLLITLLLILISSYLFFWNPFMASQFKFNWLFWLVLMLCILGLSRLSILISKRLKNSIKIPIDTFVIKAMEIFQSIPGLFLLICLISIIGSTSIIKLSLLIALLRWTSFTRLVRGETIKIKNAEYILSANALGISNRFIILRHIWPNLIRQLLIAFSYGVGSAVLMEASLSFLGLGLPPDMVSWGSLLSQSRIQINAWWLAVFPGIMISLLIASCYAIGSYIIDEKTEQIKTVI